MTSHDIRTRITGWAFLLAVMLLGASAGLCFAELVDWLIRGLKG